MRSRLRIIALLALATSLGERLAGQDFVARLPADVVLHVDLAPSEFLAKTGALPLARLLASEEAAAFIAPLRERVRTALDGVLAGSGAEGGLSVRTREALLSVTTREALFAARWTLTVLQPGGTTGHGSGVVVSATFQDASVAWIEQVLEGVGSEPGWLLEKGESVWTVTAPSGLVIARRGNLLAAAGGRELAVAVVSDEPPQPGFRSLADDPDYRLCMSEVVRPGGFISFYVRMDAIMASVFEATDETFRDFAGFFGWTSAKAIAYAAEVAGEGVRDRLYTHIPGPSLLVASSREPEEGSPDGADLAPAGVKFFLNTHLSLDRLYQGIREESSKTSISAVRSVLDHVEKLEAETGLRMSDDVLPFLGPELGVFIANAGRSLIPDVCVFAQVRDRRRVEIALERLEKVFRASAPVRRWQQHGVLFRTAEVRLEHRMPFLSWPIVLRPTVALFDDHLVVSLFPRGASTLARGLAAKTPRLASDPDFVRCSEALSGGPSPKAHGTTYIDLGTMIGFAWDFVVPLGQMLGGNEGSFPLAWTHAPSAESVRSACFGVMLHARVLERGTITEGYSPSGMLTDYMTLGLAFGALTFGRLETDVQEGPGGESGIAMARDRATVEMVVLRRVIEDHVRGTGKLPQGPGWFAELSAPDPATGNPRYPALRNLASPEGLDPWGRAYELKVLPDGSFEIISYGKDGQPGGAGDAADIIDR